MAPRKPKIIDVGHTDPHPMDGCACGDYRHQHERNEGRCKLGSLCWPGYCQRFRLADRYMGVMAID